MKNIGLACASGWLVEKAAQLLDPHEREVVRGDLAETGESHGRALISILGLVLRRRALLWTAWEPWLALILVVVPLGMLLSLISRLWADATSFDVWIYVGRGNGTNPGLRADFIELALTVRRYGAVAVWAWTCGFAIGSLSRRTAWLNFVLFCGLVLAGTIGSSTVMRNDARVFTSMFAGMVMPIMVKILMVVVPATLGIRQALRQRPFGRRTTFVCVFGIVTVIFFDARAVEMSAGFSGWRPFGPFSHPGYDGFFGTEDWKLWPLPFIVMWPAVYMLAITALQQWRQLAGRPWVRHS